MECLFCKIATKEIPAFLLFEDAETMAFLDIHPVNPGHVLIAPKVHMDSLIDASPEILAKLVLLAQRVANALLANGAEGINLLQNTGPIAGQVIPHLHFHVIPRRADDELRHWPGTDYREGEIGIVCEQIKSKLV